MSFISLWNRRRLAHSRVPATRATLRLNSLEDRTVPSTVYAGFNDALGMNSDTSPNSPYQFGVDLNGLGSAEPGWAGPWNNGYGNKATVDSSSVFEGDGALHLKGGTVQVTRDIASGVTAGKITVSQMIYVLPVGGVGGYVQDPIGDADASTAAQWDALASGTFASAMAR